MFADDLSFLCIFGTVVYKSAMKEDSVWLCWVGVFVSPSFFPLLFRLLPPGSSKCFGFFLFLHINRILGMGNVSMSSPVPQASGGTWP